MLQILVKIVVQYLNWSSAFQIVAIFFQISAILFKNELLTCSCAKNREEI
jgi:hypothetical protein